MKRSSVQMHRSRFATRSRSRVGGFTLLEVLVAIVVLSFGVLGVVGLQAAALRANKQARFQSAGVRFARELSDMMRGNVAVATATGTANPYLQNLAAGAAAPTAAVDCSATTCANAGVDLAKFQISDWVNRVQLELPGAKILVCYDSIVSATWTCDNVSNKQQLVIKIGWTQDAFNTSSTAVQAATAANPLVVVPVIPGNPFL